MGYPDDPANVIAKFSDGSYTVTKELCFDPAQWGIQPLYGVVGGFTLKPAQWEHTPQAQPKYKGVLVQVIRNGGGDCTLNGASSKYDTFLLIGDDVPEVATLDNPAQVLQLRKTGNRLNAKPIEITRHSMMGGNFVHCLNDELNHICPYPLPVHDRVEG